MLFSDFRIEDCTVIDTPPAYWYEGAYQGQQFRLPRTALVESIARTLMKELARDDRYAREGKMYGVLLVEAAGERRVLKAFSGLLPAAPAGWVPPIPGRDRVAFQEADTLANLAAMKQELMALQQIPERQQYQALCQTWQLQRQQLAHRHQQQRQQRHQQRQTAADHQILQLDEQSRQEGMERRRLKRQQDEALAPLQQTIDRADAQILNLKQQRKALSRQLQKQMHTAYWLTNFAGESQVLQQIMAGGMPTGTGDCCAPKLLHYAATQGFKPLAMAEFWWGASAGAKVQGEFYGACAERCQPLMGFLLSGSPQPVAASIAPPIYEDEWLIAVNKPAGLLSVPGRYLDRQDSVLSRLQHQHPANGIAAAHRLDQDTSGILLLSRDRETQRSLSQQFQQQQVHKVYEAVLSKSVTTEQGIIDLPLWADPDDRPYQKVDRQRGKPSVTRYRVLSGDGTRLEFIPLTGRTHQIRVHAADRRGLGIPIAGDRLYGIAGGRLCLHARELRFQHPRSGQIMHLKTETPF